MHSLAALLLQRLGGVVAGAPDAAAAALRVAARIRAAGLAGGAGEDLGLLPRAQVVQPAEIGAGRDAVRCGRAPAMMYGKMSW